MVGDTCKACDGRGRVLRHTRIGNTAYFESEESKNPCSVCLGTGKVNPPSKGGRRFFRKEEVENPSLEEQTRAFLAKHGY